MVAEWFLFPSRRALVYTVPGTLDASEARAAGRRLDELITALERDGRVSLPGPLVYPIYPSPERFQEDWWQFATLGSEVVHGWGTIAERGRVEIPVYQISRLVAGRPGGASVPLVSWGLGDLLGDRQAGVQSHAHARLFLDRTGLPAVERIIYQVDFGNALPGAYVQSVSFLAYLQDAYGLDAVVQFARSDELRWYNFADVFERTFGVPLAEADRRWRSQLAGVNAPGLSDRAFEDYQTALRFAYSQTLARSAGGLVMRPGGATAYIEALRATGAIRRFDVTAAAQAAGRGRGGLEAVQRRLHWTRLSLRVAVWAAGIVPVILAILVLAGPSIRSAWYDWRRRRRALSRGS